MYCKPFSMGSLEERRKYLGKYNFSCECGACRQDWPELNSLSSELDNLPVKQYNQPQNRKELLLGHTTCDSACLSIT